MLAFCAGIAFAQHVVDLSKVPPDFRVKGPSCDEFGTSMASGDVNGDGIDDLLVGDPMMIGSLGYQGGVRVFFGRKFTVPSTVIDLSIDLPDLAVVSDYATGDGGRAVACGDVNGDGIDDILIGDRNAKTPSLWSVGKVFVIYGRTDFSPNEFIDLAIQPADLTIVGRLYITSPYVSSRMGSSVGVTDFNGDGIGDVVAGSERAFNERKSSRPGQVCVVYGDPSFPPHHVIQLTDVKADVEIYGESDGEACGYRVAGGDVNGDGYGDLLIGAPLPGYPDYSRGHVYVVFGEPDLPSGTVMDFADSPAAYTVVGEDMGDELARVASADMNCDGYDELICSAPYRSIGGYYTGRVYVIKGKDLFPSTHKQYLFAEPADLTIEALGRLGYDLAYGDVNGDDINDLVMGKPYCAEVVFGSKDLGNPPFLDLSNNLPDIRLTGIIYIGESVGLCDLNNDGFKDVAAGSHSGGSYSNGHGAAWVVFAGGAMPYGEGLSGSGGIEPKLKNAAKELPVISTGQLELTVTEGLGGTYGVLFLSLGKGTYPFNGGFFNLNPGLLFMYLPLYLSNPGGGPGTGEASFPLAIPDVPELNITPIFLQAALHDPGAVHGISLTKGLQVSFLSKGE